MTTYGDMNM